MSHASLQLDNIYVSLAEVGPLMIACIDMSSGNIIYHNDRFERELVSSDNQLAESTIYDFVHDESYIPLARLLDEAKQVPEQCAEISFLDKQQQCYHTQLNIHANPDNPQQLILFLLDTRAQVTRDESLAVYQQIFSSTKELIALIDQHYCYKVVNRAYLEHHQVQEKDITGSTLYDLYQDEAPALIRLLDRTLKQGETVRQLHPHRSVTEQGETIFVDSMHSPYYDDQGNITGVIVSARDISEQKRAEQSMESSQRYYKMLFQYSPDMLASVNLDTGRIMESNDMLSRVLSYDSKELYGSNVFSFHAAACKEQLAEAVAALSDRDAISDLELSLLSKSGEQISVSLRTTPMVDLERNIAIFVWRDTRRQKQLAHDAVHDPLTHLLNRAGFMEQFEKPFRKDEGKILCYFDVDNFKALNDNHGHLVGDKFLLEMADLMRKYLPDVVLGRMGGDEFVALLYHDDLEVAECLMQEVNQKIREKVMATSAYADSQLGVSIGITPFSNTELRRVVLQRADNACYESKRTGKHKVTIYEVQVA